MNVRSSSPSCPLEAAIYWNNAGVKCVQQAKYTQAASSFTNALVQMKRAVAIEESTRKATDSSSMVTNNCRPSIILSGMELLNSDAGHRPQSLQADIQEVSRRQEESSTIFGHAFFIKTERSELFSSDEYSSRLVGLVCGTILLNTAIVHHLRYLTDEDGLRSRSVSRSLYRMAVKTLLTSAGIEDGVEVNDVKRFLFRFAVMAGLNNALDVTDELESLQELFEEANELDACSVTYGSICSRPEQASQNGGIVQGQALIQEWETVFQINVTNMKLNSLGLLHKAVTALAA